MPNFKYPAFVQVDVAQQRKELIEWLEMMGYKDTTTTDECYICTQAIDNTAEYLYEYLKVAICCGENIGLFKAIAAINNENDYMQWFVSNIKHSASPNYKNILDSKGRPTIDMTTWFDYEWIINNNGIKVSNLIHYHKATPTELIEHFKNK